MSGIIFFTVSIIPMEGIFVYLYAYVKAQTGAKTGPGLKTSKYATECDG